MDIWKVKYNDENTDVLTCAILHVVLAVSDHLLLEKAILLPQACKLFLDSHGVSHTSSIKSVDLDLDVGDSIIKLSSRWVLNQLMLYLNPYMECRCIHMKFGTILYRKNGNLLTSLSWALGSVTCDTSISQNVNDNFEFSINATPENHKALVLKQAGQIMNELTNPTS